MFIVTPQCVGHWASEQSCHQLKHFHMLNLSSGDQENFIDSTIKMLTIQTTFWSCIHLFLFQCLLRPCLDGLLETNRQPGSPALWTILRQECRAFLTHNTQTHPRSTTGIGHGGQDGGSPGMGLLGPLWGSADLSLPQSWASRPNLVPWLILGQTFPVFSIFAPPTKCPQIFFLLFSLFQRAHKIRANT